MCSPVCKWIAEKTGLFENLNNEALRLWQLEKLQNVLDRVRQKSWYYKNKLPLSDNLTNLPFTSLNDIARDPLAFLAIPQSEVVRITTLSNYGSAGLNKRIFFSAEDLQKSVEFFSVGMSNIIKRGQNAQILISSETKYSLGSLLKESLFRIGATSAISSNISNVESALNTAKDANCLIGMPSEILYMCCMKPDLCPESVLLTADYVPDSIINRIKNIWKCQVFTHYGHTEFGFGYAVDCTHHHGLHTRDVDFILEIIDPITGVSLKPGEKGEIVLTSLSNEAMPIIRYRTGDISYIIEQPCECGCVLNRIGKIEGRYENNISVLNNKTINIHQLDELLFSNPAIQNFQASLKNKDGKHTLFLSIDANESVNLDTLTTKLPKEIEIEVRYDRIDPFHHRGKRKINIIF